MKNDRSILVPLDGSPSSAAALPLAVSIARREGATLHLVHVHDRPVQPRGDPPIDLRFDVEMEQQMQRELDSTADWVRHDAGVAVDAMLLEADGRAAPALAEHADATRPSLIIIHSHRRGGIPRLWHGSVADLLARRSGVPVLIAKPSKEALPATLNTSEPLFEHVLLPLDGSRLAEGIADHAIAVAEPGRTRFTLLRVITPLPTDAQPAPAPAITLDKIEIEDRPADALVEFARVARKLEQGGFRWTSRTVVNARPAKAILAFASDHAVDLIALSTHGHGGISRTVLGSVADKVTRGAKTAILIYHPSGSD